MKRPIIRFLPARKNIMNLNFTEWQHIFKLAKQICRENKLKEFHYKSLHRIIVTKKELCRFGIKQDSDCL